MKNLYYAAFAAFAGLAMTSCASDDLVNENANLADGTIRMDVNISYAQFLKTRTNLSEVAGEQFANLKCTWSQDDKVHVYNAEGQYLGALEIADWKEGSETAQFNGQLAGLQSEQGTRTWNFFYVPGNEKAETYNLDLTKQSGKFEDLSSHDLLSATTEVNVAGGVAYTEDLGLERHIAFAHFNLNFGDVTYNGEDIRVVTGQGNKAEITTTNQKTCEAGDITVNQADMYFAVLPLEAAGISFETEIDGVKYVGGIEAENEWAVNDFVNAGYQNGIEISIAMEKAIDYKVTYEFVDEKYNALEGAQAIVDEYAAKALTVDFTVGKTLADGQEIAMDVTDMLNGDEYLADIVDAAHKSVKGQEAQLTKDNNEATYYVVVKPNLHDITIVIDANGGKQTAGDESSVIPNKALPYTYIDYTNFAGAVVIRENYVFKGWSLDKDATEGVALEELEDYTFTVADYKANGDDALTLTIYAIWEAKTITGGTGGPITGGGWGSK